MSSTKYFYKVISTDDLLKHQLDVVNQVKSVIKVPKEIAVILLAHYNWNQDKLVDKYFESDETEFFRRFNIDNPFSVSNDTNNQHGPKSLVEACEICFASLQSDEMTGLSCGHRFCVSCWREYLKSKIMSEGLSLSIYCAAHECKTIVDDVKINSLLDEPTKLIYKKLLIENFVACNKLLRWCPAVNCKYAIKVEYIAMRSVLCKCGHEFCFACGENGHEPVKCTWIKQWRRKCEGRLDWSVPDAKKCPKCNVTVTKDEGCQHVVCMNCMHSFCWDCCGPWEMHGASFYKCVPRTEPERSPADEDLPQTLDYYYEQYKKHFQLLEQQKRLRADGKYAKYTKLSPDEVQFLEDAVDAVWKCRGTLMYTYVFSFYVKKCIMLDIFEHHQANLEEEIQCLASIVEKNMSSEQLRALKEEITKKCLHCEALRKLLLNCANDGFEEDIWECRFD